MIDSVCASWVDFFFRVHMLRLVKVTLYVVTGVRRLAILMHNRRTLRWLHHCEDLRETLPILIIEKSDKKVE